jgi:hypothetical protein
MRFRVKGFLIAAVLLVGAIVAFLLVPAHPQRRATLLFNGYRVETNQTKKAAFALTNPAPVGVGYTVTKESGGSNTFVFNGTLNSHNAVLVEVPVSHMPARLTVHCYTQGRFRDALAGLRQIIGLRPATQSAEYTLTSDPFGE